MYYTVEDEIISKHWISHEEGDTKHLSTFKMEKGGYMVRDLVEVGNWTCGLCDDKNLRLFPKIQFDTQQEMENMFSD